MDPSDFPFTLACIHSDVGTEFENLEQAVADGWTNIVFAPDLPMANYCGLCPDCRQAEENG